MLDLCVYCKRVHQHVCSCVAGGCRGGLTVERFAKRKMHRCTRLSVKGAYGKLLGGKKRLQPSKKKGLECWIWFLQVEPSWQRGNNLHWLNSGSVKIDKIRSEKKTDLDLVPLILVLPKSGIERSWGTLKKKPGLMVHNLTNIWPNKCHNTVDEGGCIVKCSTFMV